MKILILIIALSMYSPKILCAETIDKENEVVLDMVLPEELGGKDITITIKLLAPMTIRGSSGSNRFIGNDKKEIFIEYCRVGYHCIAYTSEGDLYVDNFFVRRCDPKDDMRFGFGRFWANGIPCALVPLTDRQKQLIFDQGWQTSTQLAVRPCKLFVTPYSGSGGGERKANDGSIATYYAEGMTIVGFIDDSFYLYGLSYGKVSENDVVKVDYGAVTINGEPRSPIQNQTYREGEQAAPRNR